MAEVASIIAGKYEIVKLIGEGGMSRVYLAMDIKLNKQWAIKEIKVSHDPSKQKTIRDSLVTEANMIKQFDHPALPRIVDLINENDTLYVVMDYIEGESLERVIKEQGPQRQEDVIEWGKQLCDALDYLHTRTPPVIYRDMKPSNVMLKPEGDIKIIDFGIAREYREEREVDRGKIDDTTMLGTRGYAAPEQFGGKGQTDARTDVYCLGATMYHLLTGQSPADPPYVMHPIRQVDASFSPGLEKIITKATKQNPDDRYDSCAEMLYELEHFETVDDAHRKKLKRSWYAFVTMCVLAVVCLGVGIFGAIMAEISRSEDYDLQIELAEKATNQDEAASHYLEAVGLKPAEITAYKGLIDLYKKDESFSVDEETQLLSVLTPNTLALESQPVAYGELSYEVGKLYWYYFDYGTDAGDNRITRIRAAEKWMKEAASEPEFEKVALAEIYADVAAFNTQIVARINEGGDAGLYAPYFANLERLKDMEDAEQNEVVILETSGLISDALQTYARKFRADGIEQSAMEDLHEAALSNARAVNSTTEKLDKAQEKVIQNDEDVREAIEKAYIDARTEEAYQLSMTGMEAEA